MFGGPVGAPPLGFTLNGHGLEPVPAELAIVGEMRRLRAAGATLRAIAAWLVDRHVQTRKGGRWTAEQVRYVLANQTYEGVAQAVAQAGESPLTTAKGGLKQ